MKINKLKRNAMPYLYIAPTVILMAGLLITPIVQVIRYSFYDNAFVKKNPLPVGWLNYQKVPFATYEENYDFLKGWCAQRNAWLSDYYEITENLVINGDADRDGKVTVSDVTAIQRRLADLANPSFDERAADVDGNGLDITDATKIQQYLAELENIYNINKLVTVPAPTTS